MTLTADAPAHTTVELADMARTGGLMDRIAAASDPRTPVVALEYLLRTDKRMLIQGALVNNVGLPMHLLVQMARESQDRYVNARARAQLSIRKGHAPRTGRNPFEETITDYDPDHYE